MQVMDSKLRVLFLHASGEPIDSPAPSAPFPNRDNTTTIQETTNSFVTSPITSPINKDSIPAVNFNSTNSGDGGGASQQQKQVSNNRAVFF